jgi:hypothetical protein
MYDTGGIHIRMSMRKVMKKIFVGTSKMILKVFLRRKILGDISVEYLGSISRKNQRGLSGTIIRGTLKAPNSQLVTPISIKLQRPDGHD